MLKNATQKRITEEMIAIGTEGGKNYAVMVVDEWSLKILFGSCKTFDIFQQGVAVIEMLFEPRDPLVDLDVIYFFTPSVSSVSRMCEDFKKTRSMYNNIHVFFTTYLGPDSQIMEIMADNQVFMSKIKTLREFNLNFVAYDQRIFHIDSPDHIINCFPCCDPEKIHEVANKIASLCLTLNIMPRISYLKDASDTCELLASNISRILKKFQFEQQSSDGDLLILDRSIDLATLFVHEYTYEACAYDLLNIPVGSVIGKNGSRLNDVYEFSITTKLKEVEQKKVVLDEDDELWVRYRHRHLDHVSKAVNHDFKAFLAGNAAVKINENENLNPEELTNAVRALPEYQEMMTKYWAHVDITGKCFEALKANRLMDGLGELEQAIATGLDSDGSKFSLTKLMTRMGWFLSDGNLEMNCKMRLLLLFFTHYCGLGELEKQKILDEANISSSSRRVITEFLGTMLHVPDKRKNLTPRKKPKHRFKLFDPSRLSYNRKVLKTVEFELCRFEPALRSILLSVFEGTLPPDKFSCLGFQSPKLNAGLQDKVSKQIGGDMNWDCITQFRKVSKSSGNKPLIVFILGGVTLAECRVCWEVSETNNNDVYLGGSSIITPNELFSSLNKKSHHLAVLMD